jgi:dipeptidyl aminopeptidase/acylaminoacyl peptidase
MSTISRRSMVKGGVLSAGLSLVTKGRFSEALAADPQVGGRAEGDLFNAKNLPGGGQLEIRMTTSALNPDLDMVEVADRMKPFNPESWYSEWNRVAEKNRRMAEEYEKDGYKVSANEFYYRAARFYQEAVIYLPVADSRMLPTFNNLIEAYKSAWRTVPPPYERLEIPYEGQTLPAYFAKPRGGAPGKRYPVIYAFGGADSRLVSGGFGGYTSRGMAYLFLDGPGQGIPLRLKHMYAPPDSERVAKVVIDYLISRPDVDPNRIGVFGASIGGYTAPRCASGDSRIKACATNSGAFNLHDNIFEYYPPIRERLRWLSGAKDFADAAKKMAEFTMQGRADKIECPMLIGYRKDDRVMDPQGAYQLYQAATKSQRTMVEGLGHDVGHEMPSPFRRNVIADWFAKQFGTES